MSCDLMLETIWFDRRKYEDAEARYQETLVRNTTTAPQPTTAVVSQSNSKVLCMTIVRMRWTETQNDHI